MHSVHSWAQMVEQTLVIILFIEHSDMHIYVFPEKKTKKKRERKDPCDVRFHLCWCTIKQFFLGWNHWKHKKRINAFKNKKRGSNRSQMISVHVVCFVEHLAEAFFNPEVSNRAPRFAAGSSPNQTLQQMMSQITSSRPDWSVKPPLDHFFWCIASHPCSLSPKKLPSRARTFLA